MKLIKMDNYTAGIELSNACRLYYTEKLKKATTLKEKLKSVSVNVTNKEYHSLDGCSEDEKNMTYDTNTINRKIWTLNKELISLIDTDLELLRHFLLLNERVEEIKWQQKIQRFRLRNKLLDGALSESPNGSFGGSSGVSLSYATLDNSTLTNRVIIPDSPALSEEYLDLKYPTPSELSVFNSDCFSTTETLNATSCDVLNTRSNLYDTDDDITHAYSQSTCSFSDSPGVSPCLLLHTRTFGGEISAPLINQSCECNECAVDGNKPSIKRANVCIPTDNNSTDSGVFINN